MKTILPLFLFLFTCTTLNVQADEMDSLKAELKQLLKTHQAVEIKQTAQLLLELSLANHDKANSIEAYKFIGIAGHLIADYDTAIYWYKKSLSLAKQNNDSLNIAKAYINLATSYNAKGNFEDATLYGLKAERIFENLSDANGMARASNLLGIFHFYKKDFTTALGHFEKYNDLALQGGDTGEIVSSMNNIAATHHELGNLVKERQLLKTSIALQKEAKMGNRIGSAYENLGIKYLEEDSLTEAESYLNLALSTYRQTNNTYNIARAYNNIGLLHAQRKQFKHADRYFNKSIELSEEGGFLELKEESLKLKYSTLGKIKNYRDAFETMQRYVAVKDSVLNSANQNSINELNIKYETEKKERLLIKKNLELELSRLVNQKRRFFIFLLIIGLVLLVLLAAFILQAQKNNHKAQLSQERLRMQKDQLQVMIASQEKERIRFARDLHDGFGQLITALQIHIHQLAVEKDTEGKMELTLKAEKTLNEMHKQVREISHNLMPDALIKEGLNGALHEYVARLNHLGKLQVEFNSFGFDKRLPQNAEVAIYRVIQEWLNNIMKYASAKKATVQLTGYSNALNLLIEDDGKGFDPEKLKQGNGWGWKNILSRLETIHATLTLDTTPLQNGTSFIIDIPLN